MLQQRTDIVLVNLPRVRLVVCRPRISIYRRFVKSYWSLLAPAIEISEHGPLSAWIPPAIGFLLGGMVLWVLDKSLPHLHVGFPMEEAEGPKTAWRRAILLVTAITLHNIPERLAVGVAFGGVIEGVSSTSVTAAVVLSLGIGIQNFPEGIAVAMPLRGEGMSRLKGFWYGQLSALVEPVAAVIGAVAVVFAAPILPYALSFAADAMVYVNLGQSKNAPGNEEGAHGVIQHVAPEPAAVGRLAEREIEATKQAAPEDKTQWLYCLVNFISGKQVSVERHSKLLTCRREGAGYTSA